MGLHLTYNEISHETEKAYLFKNIKGMSFWVPKSVIEILDVDYIVIDDESDFEPVYFENTYKSYKPKTPPKVQSFQVTGSGDVYVLAESGELLVLSKGASNWVRLPSLAHIELPELPEKRRDFITVTEDDIPF